jgi:hypothetical protein
MFNGVTGYIKALDVPSDASNGFTWSVWIKMTALGNYHILDQRETGV